MNSLNTAIETLKENNFKMTDKRLRMLEILYDENKYLAAKDIQKAMDFEYKGISPDTIYRNLHTFNDLGIIESTELEGEKLFRSNCHVHGHHHHFICTNCGNTKEIGDCPMDHFQSQLPGCEITSHRFEIFGLCELCQ